MGIGERRGDPTCWGAKPTGACGMFLKGFFFFEEKNAYIAYDDKMKCVSHVCLEDYVKKRQGPRGSGEAAPIV
jgi:hypothetical protein